MANITTESLCSSAQPKIWRKSPRNGRVQTLGTFVCMSATHPGIIFIVHRDNFPDPRLHCIWLRNQHTRTVSHHTWTQSCHLIIILIHKMMMKRKYQLCRLCTRQALLTRFWSPVGRASRKLQKIKLNSNAKKYNFKGGLDFGCFYQDCQNAWGSWVRCDCLLTFSLGSPHCLIPATHECRRFELSFNYESEYHSKCFFQIPSFQEESLIEDVSQMCSLSRQTWISGKKMRRMTVNFALAQ